MTGRGSRNHSRGLKGFPNLSVISIRAELPRKAVQQVFKLIRIEVDCVISAHGMNRREQEGRIVLRHSDPLFEHPGREPDLEQVSVQFGDLGRGGKTSDDVDAASHAALRSCRSSSRGAIILRLTEPRLNRIVRRWPLCAPIHRESVNTDGPLEAGCVASSSRREIVEFSI